MGFQSHRFLTHLDAEDAAVRVWFIQAGFLCDGPVIVFQGFIVLLGTLLSKRICQIVVGFGKTLVESKGFSKLFFCLVKFLVHHQHDTCVNMSRLMVLWW